MPGQIVLVHNAARFASESASALRDAGYDVAVFTDPMQALDALDAAASVELLITRVNYPGGQPHGVALALMARNRRPGIRVVFTARAEMKPHADGIGEFLPAPVAIPDLVAVVRRLLPRRALSLRVTSLPTIREPTLQALVSGAADRPRAFSWSTRRLLQLAATTVARSQRVHDRAARLQQAAVMGSARSRSLTGRG